MEEESEVKKSPLSQLITKDGKTVRVEIYENSEGGWILEVVDQFRNTTIWDDPFKTDQAALDELFNTIDKEGIDALIGPVAVLR